MCTALHVPVDWPIRLPTNATMPTHIQVTPVCGSLALSVILLSPLAAQETAKKTPGAITVLGEIENAMVPTVDNMTLLDVVVAAKVAKQGDLEQVVLVRFGGDQLLALCVDVRAIVKTGDTKNNVLVRDGDIVVVPKKGSMRDAKTAFAVLDRAMNLLVDKGLTAARRAEILGWRLGNDPDVRVRQVAASELGKLGADAASAVGPLMAALTKEPVVAREAVTALGMIGVGAKAALPALQGLGSHEDVHLRERARVAERQIRAAMAAQPAK
jgi:hypothetical protein